MPPRTTRPSTRLRAIFFDFGGTLAGALADLGPLYREASIRSGVEVPWDRFLEEVGRTWKELWPQAAALVDQTPSFLDLVHHTALERAGATGPLPTMVREVRDEALAPKWHPPFPETDEVLRVLRDRGYALHLLSNNTDWLPRVVQNLGWTDLFGSITFSQEVGAEKPDPRSFELALQRAGCVASEALHVGDLWVADYQGARKVGMQALWLNRAGTSPPEPCESLRDLRGLLTRLPGPVRDPSEDDPDHRRQARART